jgi:hypothetical protein
MEITMKRCKVILQKSLYILTPLILMCLALLGVSAWSSNTVQQGREAFDGSYRERQEATDLKVQNRTRGLTIIRLEKNIERKELLVVLRNDYPKIVTAYNVSVGEGTIQTECLAGEDSRGVLAPGEERTEIYPLQTGLDRLGIRILAVVFDDNTSDGDPEYFLEIQQSRSGRKMQREHQLRLLRKVLKMPDDEMPIALARLEEEISPLSEIEMKKLPVLVEVGLRGERELFLRKMKRLQRNQRVTNQSVQSRDQSNGIKLRESLTILVQNYERSLSKL